MFVLTQPLLSIVAVLIASFVFSLVLQAEKIALIRLVCLGASFVALVIGVLAGLSFDKGAAGYQFQSGFNFVEQYNLTFALGVDGLSFVFLLLTLFIFPILFLSAWPVTKDPKQFFCHLMGIEILLVLTFTTVDLFYFFVLFESLLIPMFIVIGVWGARNRKIKAAYYFFLYTLFGSLFMLFGMIYLYHITGSLNFYSLLNSELAAADQEIIWLCFFLAFAVKMPLFPFHIWLPEAHVEAPTAGSMLLASLLLKLGGYGFLRFSLTFLVDASETFRPYLVALALAGVVYGSLSTLRQIDLKRIIAYSSVSHMNLVVLGLFSFSPNGIDGAVYLMVAHGVVSTALFFCVGVVYDRTHSRLLRYYGGLVSVMPLFTAAFFVFNLANMGFPGTPNFLGEILVFLGISEYSILVLFLATPGLVLAAAFSVFLFARVCYGTLKTKYVSEFCDTNRRELSIIVVLTVMTLLLGLCANTVLEFTRVVGIAESKQYVAISGLLLRWSSVPAFGATPNVFGNKYLCIATRAPNCRWLPKFISYTDYMTLLATLLPLLNFMLKVTFTRHTITHWKHLSLVVIANMVLLLLALGFLFPAIARGETYTSNVGNWLLSGLFEINWVFSIDALTYTMLLVVLTVSTLVHLYSTEYMSEDPHTARFISYLSLFTFFMLLLVTSNNFVGLFLGWEGVGLCSYLLISFWFTRIQANKAAIKAMVVNRVSDLFFTVGILIIFYTFQTVEFNTVFGLAPYLVHSSLLLGGYPISPLVLITAMLFLGAMGKSAQIGLHTWLPDAMEGPTPVSALIHAATMVTAGVFLIIRCSPLFEYAPTVLVVVTVVGAGTAFMAATSGLLQNDLKKVIAYSTCSQLGYMIFVCGLSGYTASLFHLSTHAFFKALLFLSAGAVIHAVASEQDLRRFGGLRQLLPYTYAAFFVGSIALMGVPFLSGFYSKDLILEVAGGSVSVSASFAYSLGLISAFFTSFYSFRLLHLAFYGSTRAGRLPLQQTHELSPRMATALFVLTLGTVFLGIFGRDIFVGPGTDFWNSSIAVHPTLALNQLSGEFLTTLSKQIPLLGVVSATALVFYTYDYIVVSAAPYVYGPLSLPMYRFLTFKWGFDTVYNRFINKPLLRGAYAGPFILVDKGVLEQAGPTGFGKLAHQIGRRLTMLQTGRVYDYGAGLLLSVLVGNLLMGFSGIETFTIAFVMSILPYRTNANCTESNLFQPYGYTPCPVLAPTRSASFTNLLFLSFFPGVMSSGESAGWSLALFSFLFVGLAIFPYHWLYRRVIRAEVAFLTFLKTQHPHAFTFLYVIFCRVHAERWAILFAFVITLLDMRFSSEISAVNALIWDYTAWFFPSLGWSISYRLGWSTIPTLVQLLVLAKLVQAGLLEEFKVNGITLENLPRVWLFTFIIPALAGKWVQHVITRPLWEPNIPAPRASFRDTFPESFLTKSYDWWIVFYEEHTGSYLINILAAVFVTYAVIAAALRVLARSSAYARWRSWLLVSTHASLCYTFLASLRVMGWGAYFFGAVLRFCAWRRTQIDRVWEWIFERWK